MNPWVAAAIVVLVDAVTIATMLAIRRRAPSGSFFKDTAQAAGVFTVAGTGDHSGNVHPTAMKTTLKSITAERRATTPGAPLPCDGRGRPV